ncbi:hypothetical protein [Aestuariibius sp. HNIBRBA575]|uniref:hypothetical protein n=1 Tax=Aestuariibius sp. HNIBRBA575 TaxID=3233343 RepID=UPI0034A4118A
MKMRLTLGSVALLALTACAQPVPDSGAGVGFDDFEQYEIERAQRDAALQGTSTTNIVNSSEGQDRESIGVRTDRALAEAGRENGVAANPDNASPILLNNPNISDEQDFGAVSGRESIQSDADRLREQAEAYQLADVTSIPERSGAAGPNIVQYALQTSNAKGEVLYNRSSFSSQNRFLRRCSEYQSPDAAQMDFLTRGGPERDPRGIDPDGDGFACGWDPAPYRVVVAPSAPVVATPLSAIEN